MATLAHFGTFDVENYGDLLLPAILERRLGDLGHEFLHVSPRGGPAVWDDCVPTVTAEVVIDAPPDLAGVVVGGGHIIHASPTPLDHYDQGGLSAIVAYPSLWLGAAYAAARQNAPYCWNAPGVPQAFSPAAGRLVAWAVSVADYLAVRDRTSRARLVEAGVGGPVLVVPDTALEVSRLWSAQEIDDAFANAFVSRGAEIPDRAFVVHLNRRYVDDDLSLLAGRLDQIAQRLAATPVLIALGPCHGDDQLQRDVGQRMAAAPLVIERPRGLREVAACIARAELYLGSSLHGMITACSFGTKGMVVVPASAGAFGKFAGFLEPFQLTRWIAETWEDAARRLDELVAAPREPWVRVLDVAGPILDAHWDRLRAALATGAAAEIHGRATVDKQAALARLAALSGAGNPSSTLFAPIVAEQAVRTSDLIKSAGEDRGQKERALAERNRLQAELETVRLAAGQARQALDETARERERLGEEMVGERERLARETAAAREETAAARRDKDQVLAERDRLRNALDDERHQKEQAVLDLERQRDEAATERTEKDAVLLERERLQAAAGQERERRERAQSELDRNQAEMAALRAMAEAERNAQEEARGDRERALDDLRRERDLLRAELASERERIRAEVAAERAETAAERGQKDQALREHDRMRAALEEERHRHEQARGEADRLRAGLAEESGRKEQALQELEQLRAELAAQQAAADANSESQRQAAAELTMERDQLLARLSEDRQRFEAEVAAGRVEVAAIQGQKDQIAAERDRLRAALDEARVAAQAEQSALQDALREREQALAALATERDQLLARLSEDRQRFEAEVAAGRVEVAAIQGQKDQIAAERDRLRAALDEARSAAQAEQSALQDALREREQALGELVTERDQLLARLSEERQQREEEIAATRGEVAEIEGEKDQIATERDRLRSELDDVRNAAQAEQSALQDAMRGRERDLGQLQSRHDLLQDAIRGRERELSELQSARERDLGELQGRHDLLQGELARERDERQRDNAALREAAAEAQRRHEQALAERNQLQAEAEAGRAAREADRAGWGEALRERERQLAAAVDARRTLEEQTRAASDRLQTELAAERKATARALAESKRLLRETEDLRAAVAAGQTREAETHTTLLETGQRLAQVDALLVRAARTPAGKGRAARGQKVLEAAQQELTWVRDILGAKRQELRRPEPDIPEAMPYDPSRILPGRPPNGNGAKPATANGAEEEQAAALAPLPELEVAAAPAGPDGGAGEREPAAADIVVCVHNALEDVQRCLASVVRHTGARYRLIVVDDGSDETCAAWLRASAGEYRHCTLLRNEEPSGYTKAANQGLRQSSAPLVVLLNSDTIVTPGWLERLIACAESDETIGIVGPLSNAASYQSVPERFDPNGDWALNPLPPGWDVDQLAAAVAKVSSRGFPRVPFLNGFCYAIRRAVIDAIGGFDEVGFPEGYGEENDYSLRAADAGFALAIADHAYVYHAKSRSYSHERRRELGKAGRKVLLEKYGSERLEAGEALLRDEPVLAKMRLALSAYLKAVKPASGAPRVLFLLPVSGGGGGAHSVVQEAAGMRRLGIEAQVAVRANHLARYRESYPAIGDGERLFFGYVSLDQLQAHAARFSVVVATIHTSIPLLGAIAAEHPSVIPAYYVQDYEPFFYAEGSPEREAAARSYTLVPGAVTFAKTQWLCETVRARHGIDVYKVSPSLDHDVYFPPQTPRGDGPVRVTAMIRPSSPRRGAERTMQVLQRLTAEFGNGVAAHTFGGKEADMDGARLASDFPFTNHGVLTREAVAALLRESDVFLDLSDYQAFGRTGLEAMACGCAVVVPALGGTAEYAVDGENALLVDTSQWGACYAAARALVADRAPRERLQAAGLTKAAEYSIDRAARSELDLFTKMLAEQRQAPAQAEERHEPVRSAGVAVLGAG